MNPNDMGYPVVPLDSGKEVIANDGQGIAERVDGYFKQAYRYDYRAERCDLSGYSL